MSDVSRETTALSDYAALIRRWNPSINLVSPATLDYLEKRHIQDSVQLAQLAKESLGHWTDIGSGGGLPGIVVSILRPQFPVCLIESDQRKCAFLRAVGRDLGLKNLRIVNERIEVAAPENSRNVSARALAPLPLLLSYVVRHCSSGGTAWLMKGKNWRAEVEEARKSWNFSFVSHPSATENGAAILEVTDIQHV